MLGGGGGGGGGRSQQHPHPHPAATIAPAQQSAQVPASLSYCLLDGHCFEQMFMSSFAYDVISEMNCWTKLTPREAYCILPQVAFVEDVAGFLSKV